VAASELPQRPAMGEANGHQVIGDDDADHLPQFFGYRVSHGVHQLAARVSVNESERPRLEHFVDALEDTASRVRHIEQCRVHGPSNLRLQAGLFVEPNLNVGQQQQLGAGSGIDGDSCRLVVGESAP
jgi:hypothetical protein